MQEILADTDLDWWLKMVCKSGDVLPELPKKKLEY
jgi:hypothetical protein